MKPGDLRRWTVPVAGCPSIFLVLDVNPMFERTNQWGGDHHSYGDVTFLTDGMVVTDDLVYIRQISEAVSEG